MKRVEYCDFDAGRSRLWLPSPVFIQHTRAMDTLTHFPDFAPTAPAIPGFLLMSIDDDEDWMEDPDNWDRPWDEDEDSDENSEEWEDDDDWEDEDEDEDSDEGDDSDDWSEEEESSDENWSDDEEEL